MQSESGKRQAPRTSARTSARSQATIDPSAAISSIAYALYEARGCVDGHALEDWLEAEARVGQSVGAAGVDKGRTATAG